MRLIRRVRLILNRRHNTRALVRIDQTRKPNPRVESVRSTCQPAHRLDLGQTLAIAYAARLCTEVKRCTAFNSLAFNLHQRTGFSAYIGAAITAPAASILHRHFAGAIFDNEPIAIAFPVPKLNQFEPASDANPAFLTA